MREFIEIKRRSWACNKAFPFQSDIIRTDSIINVYIDQPEGKSIVIVHSQNGHVLNRRENYSTQGACLSRYAELLEYLGVGRNGIPEGLIIDPDTEAEG